MRVTTGTDHRMADDDYNDSQALTGGDITQYRALVARISCLSQDRPDLKFAPVQVCCAMAKPSVRDMERVKRIGRYFAGKPRTKCWFRWQQSGELDVYSDADWGRQGHTAISVGWGRHESGPRNNKVCRCPPLRASCTPLSRQPPEGLGIQNVAKDLGMSCGLNLHLNASAAMC